MRSCNVGLIPSSFLGHARNSGLGFVTGGGLVWGVVVVVVAKDKHFGLSFFGSRQMLGFLDDLRWVLVLRDG